jgi:7,8-dihydro-6-hydroxymethylpterin dimethyltransferase
MDTHLKSYDFLECTVSLCPECLKTVPAKIVAQAGRVCIRKQCPRHGQQEELLEESADYFIHRNEYSRPGTGCELQTGIVEGCPYDCGLCPNHEQHTCIGLIEVNTSCDMRCPTCYAGSGTPGDLPLPAIQRMIDFYVASEYGNAEILQLSGGEPALHPRILDVLAYARTTNLAYVMLNTNGLRIARDESFVKELARLVGGFEVYLQFDGLESGASTTLRGRDYVPEKIRAVEMLERYNVPTTLVMTVQTGVNDNQIGDALAFAMRRRNIRGISFQPVTFFGRRPVSAPAQDRATLTGILQRIEAQTDGLIKASDFAPLPCHVDRVAVTFLYRKQGAYVPITRGVDLRKFLPYIRNTFAFRAEEFIQATDPTHSCCGILQRFSPAYLLKSKAERVQYINDNLFRVSVTSFIDAYNFDMKALQKECVHVITPDFHKVPFSAYNLLHRSKYAHFYNSTH